MTEAIRIQNLTKQYGNFTAVDNLSLSVEPGTLFGFLGPNGAGKSTTIGCLTGLLDPTAGQIQLLGRDFNTNNKELKRRIGVMPEGLALFDQLYAHEFLAMSARMYGLDEVTVRHRTEELLNAFELTQFSKRRIVDFSTGMRKKVAFAAAIIHSPDILFLDEPFESIDPTSVAMLKTWLRKFTSEGKTVFMTTHVLDTVERLCDLVAIIKSGRIAWQGALNGVESVLSCDEMNFDSLESLFLHITGEKYKQLEWL